MDLRQLAYFVAIAEEGSITAAAHRLHMSQPPLSLTVAQLEKELGATLLHRHPRGVTTTEAGAHLLTTARRLLADADMLRVSLRAMGSGLSGELRLGAEPLGFWNFVGEAVGAFSSSHPDVTLNLVDAPPGQLLELIHDGQVDVAVVPTADPVELASAAGQELRAEVVRSVPLVLVAPRTLAEKLAPPVPLRDLVDRTWVLPRRIPGLRILPEALDEVFAAAGRRPRRVINVSTPHTALPLVTAGLGITVATLGVAQHLPSVATVEVEGGLPALQLMLLWRGEGQISPVAQRFVDSVLSSCETATDDA